MDVFSLVARLTLDSSEYDNNLDGAKEKASTFGDKLKTVFKVGGAAIAAMTTATAAMTTAFVKGASDVAVYGDNIDKMSQKMGLSAEAYQEWDAIMQHSGTSIESLQAGMKTLANAVENGNDALERIGITEKDIAAMNNEELFSAVISGLQNVGDETERTYLAGQLLGRGATELGALLNTSAEDTEAMRQRVHELGGVMSDEAVKASARFQDSLQDMQTAFSGLKRGMVSDFLPAISDVMDGLTELFAGGGGMEQITQGIDGIVDGISKAALRVLEVGSRIILALGEAVTANLPVLIVAGTNAILTLVHGLVRHLPAIVDAGLQVVVTLASGIADSLPELTPTIVDVVLQIVDTLTAPDTLGTLVDASIAIMLALADGLIKAIPRLVQAIPKIINNLIKAILRNIPKVVQAGITLLTSLVKNLPAIIEGIVEAIPEIISAIIESLGSLGEMLAGLFTEAWEGIKDVFAGVGEFFSWVWESIKEVFSPVGETLYGFFSDAWDAVSGVWSAAGDFFSNIWEGIKSAFSPVVDTLSNFFSNAWESIKNVWNDSLIGQFFNMIWDVIKGIFSAVKSVLSGDFSGAWDAIKGVWNTVTGYFSKVWESIKGIFSDAWETFKSIGLSIVEGIWQGISGAFGWLWNKVTGFFSGIVNGVKNNLEIHSPSGVFADIGENMALGVGEGWDNEFDRIKKDIDSSLDFGTKTIGVSAVGTGAYGVGGSGKNITRGDTIINVYGAEGQDIYALAQIVFSMLQGDIDKEVAVWA